MKEQIFKKYWPLGLRRGKELLLKRPEALDFINDCEKNKLIIVGIDFYRQTGNDIIPLLNSADYSLISQAPGAFQRTANAARQLIKDKLPDGAIWVSFALTE